MDGNVRRTNPASAMVHLFFDYLSGVRDLARTAVRRHHHCAGDWAATYIQEQSVPDPCGDLFNQRPHHERAANHSQPNATFSRSLHLHHGCFRPNLHWLAHSLSTRTRWRSAEFARHARKQSIKARVAVQMPQSRLPRQINQPRRAFRKRVNQSQLGTAVRISARVANITQLFV
jgi:hypothetical protein